MENPEKPKGPFATQKEKWLSVILVILAVCVLGLIVAVIVLAMPKEEEEQEEVKPCFSEACLKAATYVMDNMDEEAKPCNDFWKYSCGDYIKSHPVFSFENKTMYSAFHEVAGKVNKKLLVLLTEEDTKDTISSVKKIKKFFNTCVDPDLNDTETIHQTYMEAVAFGGIPIVTGNMNENVTRIKLFTNFARSFTMLPFLSIEFYRNVHSGVGNTIYLSLAQTYEPRVVIKVIENVAKQANQTDSYNLTEITSFMNAYKELIESIPSFNFDMLMEEKPRNISTVMKDFPHFDLESYINGMLDIGSSKLKPDSAIVILGEEQLKNFTRLISETSLESLLNIMSSSLFIVLQSVLEPSLVESTLHGENLNTEKTRANHCLGLCQKFAPRVIGKMYVDKYFPDKNKKKIDKIVDYMSKALIAVFEENNWLDAQSKNNVLKKAKELINRKSIGYSPKLISKEFLEKRFENVTVDDNLYKNIFEYSQAAILRKMKSFKETLSEDAAVINTVKVNAQYNPMYNTISIPTSILQPPFFDMNVAEEINFGGIGTIIGHEMMHGFDNNGIKFNEKGNLDNILTNSSQKKFDERKEKLIDEYSKFLIPRANETVNGTLTVGENIADLSGMKVSYLAYTMWKRDTMSKDDILPGLNLTSEQLFFTSFAQIWCENRSKNLLKEQIETDVHSPAKARTTVTLQNFEEFSNGYYCPEGSNMNQREEIEIW